MERIHNDYIYVPLDHSKQEIRLLMLLPSENYHDDVVCHLYHVFIEDYLEYEALSYTWGDTRKLRKISLDGQTFLITEALEIALRHIRLGHKLRTLWIDAICINQVDITERSSQVRIMRQIYSEASGVIVWLGVDDSSQRPHRLTSWPTDDHPCVRCRSSWWWRVWVIQEVVVARKNCITLHYGQSSWSWETLRGHNLVRHSSDSNPDNVKHTERVYYTIKRIRDAYLRNEPMSLLKLLMTFRDWDATDPRDKVYALLGLVTAPTNDILIDYSKTVERVYMDAVLHIIDSRQDLDVLSHIARHSGRFTDCLPSWTPDWFSEEFFSHEILSPLHPLREKTESSEAIYSASAGKRPRVCFQEPDRLSVLGIAIGTVQSVGTEDRQLSDWDRAFLASMHETTDGEDVSL